LQLKKIDKEAEFVTHLLSKDKKSFGLLYDNYSNALFGIIFRIVQNDELAEDILQDVFLKIWDNAHIYDSKKSRLFTWMLNIARNASIDYLRSKQGKVDKKNYSIDLVKNIYEKPNHSNTSCDNIGLKKLVDNLKPDQKEIIDLAFFEGYTHPEIAEKLQIPLGTVKTKCRAAINSLRKSIEK
jgi:RNA polymerase sigma-70 factor (ECF subfamily)